MNDVFRAFKEQVKEVSLYFSFLRRSLEQDVYLVSRRNDWEKELNPEIHKILKANLFLILYNLAESIIRKSIVEIYDAMASDGIHYKLAKPEIQAVFLRYKCKSLRGINDQNLLNAINEILNHALNDETILLDHKSIPISGNLDAQKIRDLAKTYGFSSMAIKTKRNGSDMLTVKNRRNALAHGNETFSECGRQYSIHELKEIKDEVIRFLSAIIKNIDTYIQNKEYRL